MKMLAKILATLLSEVLVQCAPTLIAIYREATTDSVEEGADVSEDVKNRVHNRIAEFDRMFQEKQPVYNAEEHSNGEDNKAPE